jgi:hypothetical protein
VSLTIILVAPYAVGALIGAAIARLTGGTFTYPPQPRYTVDSAAFDRMDDIVEAQTGRRPSPFHTFPYKNGHPK